MLPMDQNGKPCDWWNFGCQAGDFVNDRANDAIKNMADAVGDAVGNVVKTLGTFWVNVGTPNLTATPGGSAASDPVLFLQNSLWFWTAALAVLSVLVGAAKMIIERRGSPMRDLGRSLATLVVVSGAGVAAIGLLTVAADQFSVWIIDKSTDGTSFNAKISTMLALSSTSPIGSIMIILLGLIAIIASVIQIVLMIVRGGLLVILTGIFPTAAAFTNTDAGKGWFQKCTAWLIAFILYKPAAAIVYATAFRLSSASLFGNSGDGKDFGSAFLATVTGLALMVVALFAMPALMRFVTPMVGAVAGGGGGLAAGAVGGLASGAINMGSAGRGGGSSSGSVPSGGGNESSGSSGPSGTGSQGDAGSSGTAGKSGSSGSAAAASGAEASSAGGGAAAASGGGAAAAGGGAAAGGAAAAAGPAGIAVAAGVQAGQAAAGAAKQMSEESTGGA
jgi:type IV secretion system protein TrbL